MGDDEEQRDAKGLVYEGQDLSPTTDRELKGFYAYGLAAEVFAVCGVGKSALMASSFADANLMSNAHVPCGMAALELLELTVH
jgi:hypothetical protein